MPIPNRQTDPSLSDRDSLRAVAAIAASRHASDVLETMRDEQEEAERERQRMTSKHEVMIKLLG